MNLTQLLELSGHFADELASLAAAKPEQAPPSVQAALDEARLALEHWRCVGGLLEQGSLPSALAVQLAQIDSLARALWVRHVATEEQARDFALHLSLTPDQGQAASTPDLTAMMEQLKSSTVKSRYYIVSGAREARWTYSRREIHQDWRSKALIENLGSAVLFNSNAVGALAGMLAIECIKGTAQDVRVVIARYASCLAPHARELMTSND